jgi:hypothetical protein
MNLAACVNVGAAWKAYACDEGGPRYDIPPLLLLLWLLLLLYTWLRGICAMRDDECEDCEGLLLWKASGGVCNIVIVLVDCTIGGSTSAIGTMAEMERVV